MKTMADLVGVDPYKIWGVTLFLEKPVQKVGKRRCIEGVSTREGWSGTYGGLYHWDERAPRKLIIHRVSWINLRVSKIRSGAIS